MAGNMQGRRRWVACSAVSCHPTVPPGPFPTHFKQIWMGNVLWLSTGELASNVNTDKTFNFVITPRKISGTVYWAGTSEKVAGATVKASTC